MRFFGKEIQVSSLNDLLAKTKKMRMEIYENKIILIRGLEKLTKEDFIIFCKKVSGSQNIKESFIHWNFGPVMELKEESDSKNYLFTKEKVPFHWDGAFHEVPSILAFHCLEETTGGRTLFADTTKVIMNLKESEIALLEEHSIEYETEKLAHYGGHISQKVIAKHPFTLKKILRLGEEVYTEFNPVKRIIKSENLKNIVLKLEVDLYKPSYCYAHEWKKGDLLLVDNYSLLHGREPFTNFEKKRHIRRIQIR